MQGIEFIKDLAVVMLAAGLVGWACHRVGLSVVVGYLVAGMVIGPYTPPFSLVSDIGRIETLAQVGLVFLMFSIGMGLSLRKLRRLGLALVVATFLEAVIMYNLSRAVGGVLGWSPIETAFLAAMLMVSSSAIISKALLAAGATHEKSGQLALGVAILEDVVAIVMLTILNSLIHLSGGAQASVGTTLALLGAFIALAGIGGMLLVPWLLKRMSRTAGEELPTIVVAGLLLVLAFLADRAGFSLALGAFMLGAIVAETPQRTQVGRTFEGLRDVFSAVFFVSIGMLIDLHSIIDSWALILGLAAFVLVARPLAVTIGLLVIGGTSKESLRVGLSVTPLGEFSFIIAQLGVVAGAIPQKFQAIAVGVSLLTTLVGPWMIRRSDGISSWLEARQPRWLRVWADYYHRWLQRLQQRERKNMLWQLSKRRLSQIGVEVLLVSGLLVFSEPLFARVREYLPAERTFPWGAELIFWSVLALVALGPLVAIWRNLSALSLVYAQVSTAGHPQGPKLAPIVEASLKGGGGLLLFLWLGSFLPFSGMARWLPLATLIMLVLAFVAVRRRLIYWHSMLEVELQELLHAEQKFTGTTAPWLLEHGDWNLALTDCVLPDLADCGGRTLGELALRTRFGCTVAGVERQGVMIGNPSAGMILYPRDKVLLLGEPRQIAAGKGFLQQSSGAPVVSNFDEVRMEAVTLPEGCDLNERSLAELALSRAYGLQVAGVNRGGLRILNPGGEVKLLVGDEVLVLGSPDQIAAFKTALREKQG